MNIISVSFLKSFIFFWYSFNHFTNFNNAHNNWINYVEVKDENDFITCSVHKSIKLWIKNENEFIINKIINNVNDYSIFKIIYYSNDNLI